MSKTLFPILTTPADAAEVTLTKYRDCTWDFDADAPVFRGGSPVMVEGLAAVATWAFNALKTERYRYETYSFAYGCELQPLMGQSYASETKRTEAVRLIKEALLASPYITAVTVTDLELTGSTLTASVTITTSYGEVTVNV